MIVSSLFGSLIILLIFSVPIAVALGLASIITVGSTDVISLQTFTQTMIQGLNSFALMAVPLFAFAGDIMAKGGISRRLLNVTELFFGKCTGGLGVVSIVTCMFFAAISGTGSATVAAIGMIMIPEMVRNGYDKNFAGSLVSTAGTVGVIIPPSVCMVIYAVAAGVSVTGMFMAGIVPGILVGIALIIYTMIISKKRGYTGVRKEYTFRQSLEIIIDAIPALLVPVIILGGIYKGIFTPTEAAAIAALYGTVVSMFVYKEVKISDLKGIAYNSCLICATVLVIIGISKGFGSILTITQAPVMIAKFILGITENKILILLLINILLLVIGTFMETNASIVILTPILLPVVIELGINPIHFGIIMVLNLSIGFITPPLGANLFMACQVSDIQFDDIVKHIVPWIVVMIFVLLTVTYVPTITLWLPQVMGIPI